MWTTFSCRWYDLKMNLWSSRHLEVALITCCWLKLGTCGLLPTIPNWPTQAFCAYSWVCMSGTTFTCPRPQRRIIRMTLTHMVTHTSIQLMPQIFTRFIEGWSLSFSIMHLLQTSLTFSKVCGLWLCEYDLCIDSSIQCFSVGVSGWELQCWGVYLLGINHVVCIGCSDISKGGGWTPITSWHQANDKENLAKVRALGSVSRHLPLFGSSHPFYVGPILSQSVRMCKTVAGVPGSVGCSLQKGLKSVWYLIQNSSTCPYEICLPFSLGTTCWNNWCSRLQESRHAGCDPSYTEEIGLGGYMGWWLRVIHIAWGCHPCCCLYNTRDPSVPTLAAEQVWT